jgi:DNA-binding NarL/FixJ family response regulator
MERKPIRVIVLDDHRIFRLGLREELRCMDIPVEMAGEAESGEEFFRLLKNTKADMVLLDLILPDMPGVDVARRLRKERPAMKILVLSAEERLETLEALMNIGIDGFVSKAGPANELQTAIEYIADGAEFFGRDIARLVHCVHVAKKSEDFNFTPREKEIMMLCAKGLSAKEIATHMSISLKTVINHKYNIFKKMGIDNCMELVKYAMRNGMIE